MPSSGSGLPVRRGSFRAANTDASRQQRHHLPAQPENEFLPQLIAEKVPAVSAVSYVEVLGYHRLTETERRYLEAFFTKARVCLFLSQSSTRRFVSVKRGESAG